MALQLETIYKLLIMHMLDEVEFPLTNAQITDFFLENEYATYFVVQKALNELIEDGFVFSNMKRNTSYYHLTSEGRESIKFFEKKIPNHMADDADMYLMNNKYQLRKEMGTVSDYYRMNNGDYMVHCQVKEGVDSLIELKIPAPTKEVAARMCANWDENERANDIYQFVMSKLSK